MVTTGTPTGRDAIGSTDDRAGRSRHAGAGAGPGRRLVGPLVAGDLLAAGGILALLAYAYWLGRDIFVYADEWDILAFFHDGHVLRPFNGHLSLLPVSIFRLLAVTAGWHYAAYRIVGLVAYGGLGLAIHWYARKRVHPVLAACFALWVLAFSAADINVMFPFLINFSIPLIATIVMADRLEAGDRRNDVIAAVLLAVGLISSAVGLLAAVMVATYLVLSRADWRRAIPFLPPLAVWGLWYLKYHEANAVNPGLGKTARYALDMVAGTFTALGAGSPVLGVVVFLATVAVLVLGVLRWHTLGPAALRWFAAGGVFVAITSYTRIGTHVPGVGTRPYIPADTGRYTWVLSIYLLLGLAEVLRGVRLPRPSIAAVAVVVALGAWSLVGALQIYHRDQLRYRRTVTTALKGVDAVGDKADPERILPLSFIPVRVKDYLSLTRHIGAPFAAAGLAQMGKLADRQLADVLMAKDLGITGLPVGPDRPGCATAGSPGPSVTVDPGHRVLVQGAGAPAGVRLTRFAPTDRGMIFPNFGVDPGQRLLVAIPRDHSPLPWTVHVDGGATVVACR